MIALWLILYNFCANLSNDIYLPSMPTLVEAFATDSNTLQFTMTAWFIGVALPQLFFGPMTDQFGRRPILLTGGCCFLISTLFCLSANHIWTLIIGRFFQGVGVCSLNVTTFSILADLFDYQKRTQIMNKINTCGILAPLIGPVIGGYVLFYFGWRINFLIIFILGFMSVLGLFYKLPESNLYLNPYALNFRNVYKNYYLLTKTPGFLRHLIPYCLMLGGLVTYLTAAPFIIINQFKIEPQNFGFTQLPIFMAYILGSIFLSITRTDERIKQLLVSGLISVLFGALFLLITSYFFGDQLFCFITAMVFYAFGLSLCASPLVNEVMSSAIVSKGSAAAVLGFGMALSCALFSMLLSLIYNGHIMPLAIILLPLVILANVCYFKPNIVLIFTKN